MADQIARHHGFEQVERHRDHNFTLEIYQSDDTPAGLAADDVVRFKVWQTADTTPTLDIDSVALPTATFTADGTDVITSVAHGRSNGERVKFSSAGTIPPGLSASIVYYVINAAADTFKVSLTSAGAAVDITGAGTGTHTWTRVYSKVTIDVLGVTGTTAAQVTAQLHRDEVNLLAAGEWNWEASVVKPASDNRIFVFASGIFDVVANATGDLGVA
jgi:hypothetical protein